MERARLAHFFERQYSLDSVGRFKPAPVVYDLVVKLFNVPPLAICLVAAHTWGALGAQSVGFSAGIVTRTGNAPLESKEFHNPKPYLVISRSGKAVVCSLAIRSPALALALA